MKQCSVRTIREKGKSAYVDFLLQYQHLLLSELLEDLREKKVTRGRYYCLLKLQFSSQTKTPKEEEEDKDVHCLLPPDGFW